MFLAALPLIAFGSIFYHLLTKSNTFRHSFLLSSILWGLCTLIITETLSLFQAITPVYISLCWISIAIAFFVTAPKNFQLKISLPKFDTNEIVIIFFIIIFALLIGITAWFAAPNTWDSMTYHMSRVAHWVQNQSVSNYPTHIIRQLNYTPWAEFAILQFQILLGSDQLANFIQWFAMIDSLIGISLITQLLGGDRKTQLLCVLLCISIPMGIVQASGTQNDYVATLWIVTLVYLLLKHHQAPFTPSAIFFIGTALGLAFLTKGYCYLYGLSFIAFYLIRPKKESLLALIIVLGFAFLLNTGYYLRNVQLTQTLLPPSESNNIMVHYHTFSSFISITSKNILMHFFTPLEGLNTMVQAFAEWIHKILGLPLADVRTTMADNGFQYYGNVFHEDQAPNGIHLLFIWVALVGFFFIKKNKALFIYSCAAISAFIALCFLLKWTPFHSRYHLTLFVLSSSIVAVNFNTIFKNKTPFIIIILSLSSLPWLLGNTSRSLLGNNSVLTIPRIEQYFTNNKGFEFSYQNVINTVSEEACEKIGLITGPDHWEYPLWALAKQDFSDKLRIEHVLDSKAAFFHTKEYPLSPFEPCAIIDLTLMKESHIHRLNHAFSKSNRFAFSQIFLLDDDGHLVKKNTREYFTEFSSNLGGLIMALKKTNPFANKALYERMDEILWKYEQFPEMIDLTILGTAYPGLKILYKKLVIDGLTDLRSGLDNYDTEQYQKGLKKLAKWQMWFNKNRQGIQKGLLYQ